MNILRFPFITSSPSWRLCPPSRGRSVTLYWCIWGRMHKGKGRISRETIGRCVSTRYSMVDERERGEEKEKRPCHLHLPPMPYCHFTSLCSWGLCKFGTIDTSHYRNYDMANERIAICQRILWKGENSSLIWLRLSLSNAAQYPSLI